MGHRFVERQMLRHPLRALLGIAVVACVTALVFTEHGCHTPQVLLRCLVDFFHHRSWILCVSQAGSLGDQLKCDNQLIESISMFFCFRS